IKLSDNMSWATIVGFVMLLFSASGVFAEIQSSINYIWELKPKPKKGIMKMVVNRLLSFSTIGVLGFILLISLIINTLVNYLYDCLAEWFPVDMVFLVACFIRLLVLVIVRTIFGCIFKTLLDVEVGWRDTIAGYKFTAVLFMLGKWAIGLYLGN